MQCLFWGDRMLKSNPNYYCLQCCWFLWALFCNAVIFCELAGDPGPWWDGLREWHASWAVLSRRSHHRDLWGNEWNSATGHRWQFAEGIFIISEEKIHKYVSVNVDCFEVLWKLLLDYLLIVFLLTCTQLQTYLHAHMHLCMHACMHTHTHVHAYMPACTYIQACSICVYTHVPVHEHTHTHTHTHARTHAHTHTRTQARMHTHARTHMHTHMHAHILCHTRYFPRIV